MNYSELLMQKFVEWEKAQGRRQSFSAFARYLGVKQSSLSQWLAGNYPPSGESLIKLARKLGYEIYDTLEIPRPDPSPLDALPLSLRVRLSEALTELESSLKEKEISPDSPEGEAIAIEIFRTYGFTTTAAENSEQVS